VSKHLKGAKSQKNCIPIENEQQLNKVQQIKRIIFALKITKQVPPS
jgi:hypothetical protein